MNKKNVSGIFIILLIKIIFKSSGLVIAQSVVNIEVRNQFPKISDINYLQSPQNFVFDNQCNKLFINDQPASQILAYHSNGKFINEIGREGKGPGELINPSGVVFGNGYIFVNDQGNQRIQIFKESGEFIESIVLDEFPFWGYSFAYHDEKLIFFPRYHLGLAGKDALKNHSLFKILDLNGKKLLMNSVNFRS